MLCLFLFFFTSKVNRINCYEQSFALSLSSASLRMGERESNKMS
jgi:hypothetical protein